MLNSKLASSLFHLISLGLIKGICPFVYFSLAVLFQANRLEQKILCTVKDHIPSALTIFKDPQAQRC